MRLSAPIIVLHFALLLATALESGCSTAPANILESDVPNVAGMDVIVTRDIVRSEGQIVGVNVIYRGDVIDCQVFASETKSAYDAQGWWLLDEQARGTTTVLNFGKDQRRARIEIAENQIDPMMSPAILRLSLAGAPRENSPKMQTQLGGGDAPSTGPEGFAPPSE